MVCLIDHTVCKETFSLVNVKIIFLILTSNYTKLWALTIFKFNYTLHEIVLVLPYKQRAIIL